VHKITFFLEIQFFLIFIKGLLILPYSNHISNKQIFLPN